MDNDPMRVLLVDDDQGDFEMIRSMLSKAEHQNYQIDWVSTFEEALDSFESTTYDVYFLDYFLEDRTGLDLLREARSRGISAPIIMLTGRGSRTVDMEAMDLGASDYLVKGLIDPDALERAIRHAVERVEGAIAIRERGELQKALAEQLSGDKPEEGGATGAARFRAVFEATRSGIALMDLQGGIMAVNPAFAGIFAPGPRWTEGMSYLDLLDDADREAVGKELQALAKGERAKFEAARRFMAQSGGTIWAHTTVTLIRNPEGEPDHLVVVLDGAEKSG